MIIRNILPTDFDSIIKLNQKFVNVLSPLDEDKLLELINLSALTVVIEDTYQGKDEEKNTLAGFFIVLKDNVKYKNINYQWFKDRYNSFLYIDRIVISEPYQKKRAALSLYQYVFDLAKNLSISHVFAEIDMLPANEASLSFHKKMGFRELGLLKHNDTKVVSLQGFSFI